MIVFETTTVMSAHSKR